MADFYPVDLDNSWSFIRGPARLMLAPIGTPFPTQLSDLIVLASGVSQYSASGAWTDVGATKGGVQIAINHAEETFDVDQVLGDIESAPTSWECSVSTAFAEPTLEHLQIAWEGSAISTNSGVTPNERTMGYGQPTNYTRRRLAVLYKSDEDKIRAHIFRRVQLQPVESQITFNKTGDQISVPVQFKGLADASVSDVKSRFFSIIEQV